MNETVGTLNLKIAKLEQQIQILKQRLNLSSVYPEHRASLSRQREQVELFLDQLIQYRDNVVQNK